DLQDIAQDILLDYYDWLVHWHPSYSGSSISDSQRSEIIASLDEEIESLITPLQHKDKVTILRGFFSYLDTVSHVGGPTLIARMIILDHSFISATDFDDDERRMILDRALQGANNF